MSVPYIFTRSDHYIAPDATPEELREGLATALTSLRHLWNATHPRTGKPWIGFDLDRTLARYDTWRGETHIGEPIPAMVELVREKLAEGYECRVFTARVSEDPDGTIREAVEAWTEQHIGVRLGVTSCKDFDMVELYDDRAWHVVPNRGVRT